MYDFKKTTTSFYENGARAKMGPNGPGTRARSFWGEASFSCFFVVVAFHKMARDPSKKNRSKIPSNFSVVARLDLIPVQTPGNMSMTLKCILLRTIRAISLVG